MNTGHNGSQPFKKRERIRLDILRSEFEEQDSEENKRYGFPDHTWIFWSSPSPEVWIKLFGPSRFQEQIDTGRSWSDEEYRRIEGEYFEAISEIVLDTGESNLDLSTPDAVHSAFFNGQVDVDLLGAIITTYTAHIARRFQDMQKKTQDRSAATAGSSIKSRRASKSRR